jgi:hypothetical protein
MKPWVLVLILVLAVAAAVGLGIGGYQLWWHAKYYIVERTEYHPPDSGDELTFVDDRLQDKTPTWDPELIHPEPIGEEGNRWQVNQSAAVIKLDCPMLKPDRDRELLLLRPSYAAAMQAARKQGWNLLPSANLLDGAAKQFDDGLYAALDQAAFRGELGLAPAAPNFIEAVFGKLDAGSPARAYLAVALELAQRKPQLPADQQQQAARWKKAFESDQARSKPISFYTWTPELQKVWRFYRFLQYPFVDDLTVPRDIAAVLAADADLRKQYAALTGFYARLTNPLICLSVEQLIGTNESLEALAKKHRAREQAVAVFPPSTSREAELFNQAFPLGLPAGTNLMARLIHAIRSGEVKLEPTEGDGWYQYQVYALETLLLPSKGQEEDKLLLTASYKKRLVEAFKALITKRRETHARQGAMAGDKASAPLPEQVQPRLRIEPCATFYLRTARAYGFLRNFLHASVGQDRLAQLHGLKKDGLREPTLADELDLLRQRFYGLYLITCEDIGMRPRLLPDELVDEQAAKEAALAWIKNLEHDPDLARDTRVSVPIYTARLQNKTRLWATLGIRFARLEASYARPPKVRPQDGGQDWQEAEPDTLSKSHYVIAVDEFSEFELPGSASLTRNELRALCDRHQTKEEIVEALSGKNENHR